MPAPTRIRAVAASKESYLLLAETGQVYEGLFDDAEPRPIEALAQARCRSVACGEEHYLVATFDAVWKSNCRGASPPLRNHDLTPSTRRLLDGLVMPVPHRSPSQDGRVVAEK